MNKIVEIIHSNFSLVVVETKSDSTHLVGLLNNFTEYSASYLEIKSEKRKKEFLAPRILLNELLGKNVQIEYDKNGKPTLESKLNISISHSKNFYGVIVSKNSLVGLDIEYSHQRYEKIVSKFVSEFEKSNIAYKQNLDLIWGAKECIFKIEGSAVLDFKEHINITEISSKNLKATTSGQNSYIINYCRLKDCCITYCTSPILHS